MARRNTYREDEILETPFEFRHLLLAFVYVKKYAGRMGIAFLISALGGILGLFGPMLTQRALDDAIPNKNTSLLFILVGIYIATFIVSIVLVVIRSRIMINVSQNIIFDIRKDVFAHLQKLPFQYYDDRPHGKILIRVVNYVNSVSDMLSNGLINVVLEIMNLIFIVIFMLMVDVKLLQMLKHIFSDIKDDILAHVNHDFGTNCCKDDCDYKGDNQQHSQCQQQFYILIRNRIVQRFLGNHRSKQAHNTAECTQEESKPHTPCILLNINKRS